ncbi:MAG: tetratricopeptide repeat protein [bacterium]|nr:tetratricopeptide repeat protein [bacterium]
MSRDKKKAQKDKKRREAKKRAQALDAQRLKRESGAATRTARASTLFQRGRDEHLRGGLFEAEATYRKVLEFDPDHAAALTNLAVVLNRNGRAEDALAAARKSVELSPEFPEGHLNLGGVHLSLGEMELAAKHFERACELRPDFGDAHVVRTTLRKYESADDEHVREMEALVARRSSMDRRAAPLHFALAKAYEDIGDYDRAFEHLSRGNRLHRASIQYDLEFHAGVMRRIAALHGAEFLGHGADPSCSESAPILIVGMPRSGTTLVEQILAAHSGVTAVGEVGDLEAVTRSLCSKGDQSDFPEALAAATPAKLALLGKRYVELLERRAPGAARVVDKGLSNFLHVGFLHRALPNARIVHCRRNPADTCLSCFKTLFSSHLGYTYDLTELGQRYGLYQELMDHWHSVLPGGVLDVVYEDVVADQERQSRRLLEFCGLEWQDGCLEFHRAERRVHTASVTQVRQPIYKSAVARWKRYEKHLGPLFDALPTPY